jgi:hypothetical protein
MQAEKQTINFPETMILLSTCYLAPVEYFKFLLSSGKVTMEACENYTKQSYRNRCRIATANGAMDLSIPIEKSCEGKMPVRDVKISYSTAWQQQHWRALESAYLSSAFFEYYCDELQPFYKKQWKFLWDFNSDLLLKILDLLDAKKEIALTEKFVANCGSSVLDLRDAIHPKKASPLPAKPYYQVFDQKLGFVPALSIVDLLFNMGNESILWLKEN